MIFVGYDNNSDNYRLFNPEIRQIKVSRDVMFNKAGTYNRKKKERTFFIFSSDTSGTNTPEDEEIDRHGDELVERNNATEDPVQSKELDKDESLNAQKRSRYQLRDRKTLNKPARFEANFVDTGYFAIV